MPTPENKVKDKVKKLLSRYGEGMWTYWPVMTGMGRKTVDLLGCYRGNFFVVETKAEGKKPTLLQTIELQTVERAMGRAFVIAGLDDPAFGDLEAWLESITASTPYDPHVSEDQTNRRII